MSDASHPRPDPIPLVARELGLPPRSVEAVVRLLAEKATVPFIARYRKEVTGDLDEVQIRAIEEKHAYLLELEERRAAILQEIAKQEKLTPELRARILSCATKAALEDLYLPYKPKRRTRAIIARERGLEPLALRILAQGPEGNPAREAAAFVSVEREVPDVAAALKGARDIVAEVVAERAEVRAVVREAFDKEGLVVSAAVRGKTDAPTKFEQYYDWREPVAQIPSHRFLAIRRGEGEGILRASVEVDEARLLPRIARLAGLDRRSPFGGELEQALEDALHRLLAPSVETDVRVELKLRADRAAVEVFADNLKNLLLSAPLGAKRVIGIDPGLRTGCKVAVVDDTGRFVANDTIYPSQGEARQADAARTLLALVKKHAPLAIAIGNGTAGRETEAFVKSTLRAAGHDAVLVVSVSEAGASVYSASDVAREEFPELDLTVRGAISIARRLQDPLAELVKVDPKSIGVGQYQHDVYQPLLARKLGEVVESCVNRVGVELNTASASLLAYVAGIGPALAKKIVAHREAEGAFASRKEVLRVSGLGPRAFEQCAGFLRVHGAAHPLDRSAVHPERYDLVARMAADLGVALGELVGNAELVKRIDLSAYVGEGVGEPTLRDIVGELEKPGRDPRASFEPPKFRDDVMEIGDLSVGMVLEGVVTNVTAFGAFVDLGVHQDGLVHVSKLADRYVKDPREVVKVGDRLNVKVLEVDLARRRISLTARMSDAASPTKPPEPKPRPPARGAPPAAASTRAFSNNPFAGLRDKKP